MKLSRIKSGLKGTPEVFLGMVMEFQSRNNKEFVVHEVLQWGELMQKMMKVDFAPYTTFADLLQNGVPDYIMVKKVRGKFDEIHGRVELKKAIYGENVDQLKKLYFFGKAWLSARQHLLFILLRCNSHYLI